jgi:serine/threonine protein kinase
MKLFLIVSLVSDLNYLHKNGIVHRELKPNDLIIERDGSLRICDYAMSIFEEHQYTKATQVGGPSYMAPEVYDDEEGGKKIRDPKMDVFFFFFWIDPFRNSIWTESISTGDVSCYDYAEGAER